MSLCTTYDPIWGQICMSVPGIPHVFILSTRSGPFTYIQSAFYSQKQEVVLISRFVDWLID